MLVVLGDPPAVLAVLLPTVLCWCADKLLQTKLREKEIKEALKEQKNQKKEEKEEVCAGCHLLPYVQLVPT
jgi:hypothetical protein